MLRSKCVDETDSALLLSTPIDFKKVTKTSVGFYNKSDRNTSSLGIQPKTDMKWRSISPNVELKFTSPLK